VAAVAESVTKDGSAFQTRAPATGKARLPIVILRVGGTTSADVDAERSRLVCLFVCMQDYAKVHNRLDFGGNRTT